MLIKFSDAHDALEPYFDGMWNIINGAWEDWQNEVPAKLKSISTPRTRASMINDFMKFRGIRFAEEHRTINFMTRKQMFILVFSPSNFDGCIGIRLKKFDEDGLSMNQHTKQVHEFRSQVLFPEIGATHHLEAGYIMNQLGSSLTSINLVCPSGKGNYWISEITPGTMKQSVQSLFSDETNEPAREAIVRKKTDKSRKADEAKNVKGT